MLLLVIIIGQCSKFQKASVPLTVSSTLLDCYFLPLKHTRKCIREYFLPSFIPHIKEVIYSLHFHSSEKDWRQEAKSGFHKVSTLKDTVQLLDYMNRLAVLMQQQFIYCCSIFVCIQMRQTCSSTGLTGFTGIWAGCVIYISSPAVTAHTWSLEKTYVQIHWRNAHLELVTCVSRVLLSFRELLIICWVVSRWVSSWPNCMATRRVGGGCWGCLIKRNHKY